MYFVPSPTLKPGYGSAFTTAHSRRAVDLQSRGVHAGDAEVLLFGDASLDVQEILVHLELGLLRMTLADVEAFRLSQEGLLEQRWINLRKETVERPEHVTCPRDRQSSSFRQRPFRAATNEPIAQVTLFHCMEIFALNLFMPLDTYTAGGQSTTVLLKENKVSLVLFFDSDWSLFLRNYTQFLTNTIIQW